MDVRVIAAPNKDLRREISQGRFREDLYHRLAVILIDVPSLNDRRREDIPRLVKHFNEQICREYSIASRKITQGALQALQEVHWTGNVRELRNVVERLIILSRDSIDESSIQEHVLSTAAQVKQPLADVFARFESLEEIHRYIDQEYDNHKANGA